MNAHQPPAERGETVNGPIDRPIDGPIDGHADVAAGQVQPPPMPPASPGTIATEIGGPAGPEPTRYGDWERNGRCFDF